MALVDDETSSSVASEIASSRRIPGSERRRSVSAATVRSPAGVHTPSPPGRAETSTITASGSRNRIRPRPRPALTTSPIPSPPRGVTGPIPRELFRLAVPVLASQLLRVAYQWVDALWVRGLGVEATAAVTTSMFVLWTVYSLSDVV